MSIPDYRQGLKDSERRRVLDEMYVEAAIELAEATLDGDDQKKEAFATFIQNIEVTLKKLESLIRYRLSDQVFENGDGI